MTRDVNKTDLTLMTRNGREAKAESSRRPCVYDTGVTEMKGKIRVSMNIVMRGKINMKGNVETMQCVYLFSDISARP